jgi:hypothetical protein
MLAVMLLQLPLALIPAPTPPTCLLEVQPRFVREELVLRDFNRRVVDYVRLHRRLERSLPPEQLIDMEDMSFVGDELRAALVAARPQAQPGEFFTPAVADVITARLEQAIAGIGLTPAEVVIAMNLGYRSGIPQPKVNAEFPGNRYLRIWPSLLAALPALPDELEYRFVYRDLVLVDTHANLVVDILKDALPPPYADLLSDFAAPRKNPQVAGRGAA